MLSALSFWHIAQGLVVTAQDPLSAALGEAKLAGGATTLRLLALFTLLSLAPAIILTMTCFTRFFIVFSFLKQSLGVQNAPPMQVITGLALFMTVLVMSPVGERSYVDGIAPYLDGKIDEKMAIEKAVPPLKRFMMKLVREEDLKLFYEISHKDPPQNPEEVSMAVLLPAFVTSELRTSFEMGFLIFIPFLIIDMVVASILMSMGMAMLSPIMISTPLKILVFVFVDGWNLVIGSLARSVMS